MVRREGNKQIEQLQAEVERLREAHEQAAEYLHSQWLHTAYEAKSHSQMIWHKEHAEHFRKRALAWLEPEATSNEI